MIRLPKVFLDLDRTLFDTDKTVELWDEWAKHYNITPEVCVADRERFFVWKEGVYTHDLSAQLRSYGIDPEEAYSHIINSPLSDGRFELPYANELVLWLKDEADVAVLTYGPDDYQRLKAALCPSLQGISVITTLEHKSKVLVDVGECWLVDDKDLGKNHPKNVHLVQVIPPGGSVDTDKPWPVLANLKEVKEYLYGAVH